MKSSEVLVSVCVTTYNHQNYLNKTLDSILKQKCCFEIEVILGEDCSTDNTRKICEEYYSKYPNLIKLLPSDKNHGALANLIRTVQACNGRYIAICEGDDYWTDSYKLQKQVAFLDENSEYGMISSDVYLIDENGDYVADNQMIIKQRLNWKKDVTFIDLLEINLINTLTICVRSELLKQLINRVVIERLWFVFDYWFWLNVSLTNKISVSNEKTAAYRIHKGGISRITDFIQQRKPFVLYDSINIYRKRNVLIKRKDAPAISGSLYYILRNSKVPFTKKISVIKVFFLNPILLYYLSKLGLLQFKNLLQTKVKNYL